MSGTNTISDETEQKVWKVAKYTGYTAVGAVVFTSAVVVGLSVVNNLFKPEYLGKLGENNIFKIAAVVGSVIMTAALIGISVHNCKLKNDDKILRDGINYAADEKNTDLNNIRASVAFKKALALA